MWHPPAPRNSRPIRSKAGQHHWKTLWRSLQPMDRHPAAPLEYIERFSLLGTCMTPSGCWIRFVFYCSRRCFQISESSSSQHYCIRGTEKVIKWSHASRRTYCISLRTNSVTRRMPFHLRRFPLGQAPSPTSSPAAIEVHRHIRHPGR